MRPIILMLALLATVSHAKENRYDRLLGPWPEVGTSESDRDFEILHQIQNTRTEAECAKAQSEVKVSLESFFGGSHALLTDKEIKKIRFRMGRHLIEATYHAGLAKNHFSRPRPYETDETLRPCIEKSSTSAYPSGHTTIARVYARVLSEIFPDRAEAFMKRADEVAWNRVVGGVHHPSDIAAGKILADDIADKIMTDLSFGRETIPASR